jgi:hypothetical protein
MSLDKITATDQVAAITKYNTTPEDTMGIDGYYTAVCYGADGSVKWTDNIENIVTTVGRNLTLNTILGNAAAGAVVMGLKGVGTAAASDTQASHPTWLEVGGVNLPTYSGNRPTPSFAVASAGSKATSSAVSFSMTGAGVVAGCFINIGGSATKDNTDPTLFSAGDFSSSKSVVNGDTIAVTYTLTLTAT